MLVVRAVHTFVAEHADELEFQAGEDIEVIERDEAFGDGWWRGRNTKGEEGLFPATYISEESLSPNPNPPNETTIPPVEAAPALSKHHSIPPSPKAAAEAPKSDVDVVAPLPPSPKGGSSGILPAVAAGAGAAAVGATTVMGKTIGEIQNAIESIAKPGESDDEHEQLGIGQDTRARLAEQAKIANEQRDRNRGSGGVAGLVYSDESEDEEDDIRRTPKVRSLTNGNGYHEPKSDAPAAAAAAAAAVGSAIPPVSPALVDAPQSQRSLEPALPLPSTPPLGGSRPTSGIPAKPATQWSVDEVVDWAKAKGFDEGVWSKFREHEIAGDLLLELDANLLKELDIPQFGKRLRVAQAISELRRPTSLLSSSSQQQASSVGSNQGAPRGMSAPPMSLGKPPVASPTQTPPEEGSTGHTVWTHGRKISTATIPSMQAIKEGERSQPISPVSATTPTSPATPGGTLKRESSGSTSHKRGKLSIDNKERLSFFSRARKPAPTTPGDNRPSSRLGVASTKVHQMQPASPQQGNGTAPSGTAAALRQIGAPDHAGYMKKKGERYGTWKMRYFVLKGPHLYYMNSEQEDRVKGHIALAGHRVIVDENLNPGSYGFRLVGPDKPHYFSSSEQTSIREWMKALMKATIARDYTVAVTSSCNIPTIPLAEAQALAPRPPSPATRDATQRATRRENTNQLTAHDASILMSLDTSSGQRRRASQQLSSPQLSPGRPSRDLRRPSSSIQSVSNAPVSPSFAAVPSQDYSPLVQWVNSNLPPPYPKASSLPQSFVSGEVIFLLVRHLSGIEPSPPVPPTAFAPESDGSPGLSGLFAMMDIIIDAGVDTAGVSINDVRSGDAPAIARLLESIKSWATQSGVGAA